MIHILKIPDDNLPLNLHPLLPLPVWLHGTVCQTPSGIWTSL